MLDDHVAAAIEQRGFEFLLWFDMEHFDIDAIVAFCHRLDAVDHRRAVVVPVGEADGGHG